MTTHLRLIPGARPSAKVAPITADTYDRAMRIALSADNDWGRQLAAARTLAESPDWKHQNLARHIRDAHALHEARLLKPAVLDLTPEMRVRGTVTVVTRPPYSAGPGTIRRVLVGTAAMLAVGWLGLAGVMVW